MTFPTIPTTGANTLLASVQGTATTTHTFGSLTTLDNASGDLLIAVIVLYQASATGNAFSSWGGGFTEFPSGDSSSATDPSMAMGCAYKISDGTETGTFTVTSSISGRSAMFLMSVKNWHGTTVPEVAFSAATTTTAQDPPSLNPSGWDAEDTLWIAVAAGGQTSLTGSWTGITSAPANYTDYAESSIAGGDAVGACQIAVAFRGNNTAAEDPGSFTTDTSPEIERAATIAVRPAPTLNPVHASHTLVAGFTSDTSITFTEPSGYSSNDIMVVKLYLNTNKTVTPPGTGSWAQPTNANATIPTDGYQQQIWWKRGDVGGGLTFSWTGATGRGGSAHRISGAETSGDPWNGTPDHQTTSTGATNSPTVSTTTTVPNTLLVHFRSGSGGSPTWAPSSGYTEVYETQDFTADWIVQAAAGSSGSVVGTHSIADRQAAFLGALKPPGGDATVQPAVIARSATLPAAGGAVGAGPAVAAGVATLPASNRNVGAGPAVIPITTTLPNAARNVAAGPAVLPAVAALPQAAGGVHTTVSPAVIARAAALAQPNLNVAAGLTAAVAAVAALPQTGASVGAGPASIALAVVLPQATPTIGGTNATATPDVIAVVAALPQAAAGVPMVVTPAVIALLADVGMGIAGNSTVGAAVVPLVAALPQATPQAGGGATPTPAVVAAVAALPNAARNVAAGPATISTLASLPGAGGAAGAGPGVLGALTALARPSVNVAAGPAVVAGVGVVPAPTVTAGGNVTVTPAVLAALAALDQVTVSGAGRATPAVAAAVAALARPLVDIGAGPAVIARAVVLPAPTVLAGGGATVTPAVVAALAALTQPNLNVRAGPAVVAALAALGQAQPGQFAVAAPAVIARAVTIPQAGASVGASPAVIALVALLPLVTDAGGEPVPGNGHITIGVAAGLGLVVHPTGGAVLVDQHTGELRIA